MSKYYSLLSRIKRISVCQDKLDSNSQENIKSCRNNYYIKEGYSSRSFSAYYEDIEEEILYQPDVYKLAHQLAKESGAKYIIDVGSGNGSKLKRFLKDFRIISIDYGKNIKLLKKILPDQQIIEYNLKEGLPSISDKILKQAVLICSDVVEHIKEPEKLFKDLSRCSYKCLFILISTPDRDRCRGVADFGPPLNTSHIREWNLNEFYTLLKSYCFNGLLIGYTVNSSIHLAKTTTLALSGLLAKPKLSNNAISVLAIINIYNEKDIIAQIINCLLNDGIDVRIIDNWSTDGSFELVCKMAKKNKHLTVERFPKNSSAKYYEWRRLLRNTEKIASRVKYDWIIHQDADEIRISPWEGISFKEAIGIVDDMGFNAIDFTVVDFRPTRDGFTGKIDPETFYTHFEFGKRSGHFLQIKVWENQRDIKVDLSSSGGHEVVFRGRKVFPLKFISKHYPLRSRKQARKKIFFERLNRFSPKERSMNWHTQYDKYSKNDDFIWKVNSLISYSRYTFMMEYLVERISGIGIIR